MRINIPQRLRVTIIQRVTCVVGRALCSVACIYLFDLSSWNAFLIGCVCVYIDVFTLCGEIIIIRALAQIRDRAVRLAVWLLLLLYGREGADLVCVNHAVRAQYARYSSRSRLRDPAQCRGRALLCTRANGVQKPTASVSVLTVEVALNVYKGTEYFTNGVKNRTAPYNT